MSHAFSAVALAVASLAGLRSASAHVIGGVRVLPVTLAFDDPAVGDEVPLPRVVVQPGPGERLSRHADDPPGGIVQVHPFFDDLFPASIGKPLFQ